MLTQTQQNKPTEPEQDQPEKEEKSHSTPPAIHYEEVELIDWEEKFRAHIEETKRLEKEIENKSNQIKIKSADVYLL